MTIQAAASSTCRVKIPTLGKSGQGWGTRSDRRARRPPQAFPGFAHARRQLRRRHRAAAAARLHPRRELSRKGAADAGGLRRHGRAVRDLRRHLRHRRLPAQHAAHASGDGGQRRTGGQTLRCRRRSLRAGQVGGADSGRERGDAAEPATGAGRDHPQPAGGEGRQTVAVVCSDFTCQPPVSDPEQLSAALRQALRSRAGLRS